MMRKNERITKILSVLLILLLFQGNVVLYSQVSDLNKQFEAAKKEYNGGKYPLAIKRLKRLLVYLPRDERELKGKVLILLGACYERMGNIDEARDYYMQARELLPGTVEIAGIDLSSLREFRRIFYPTTGVRLKEGKRRGFPFFLVVGGLTTAGVVGYLAFRKGGFLNKGTAILSIKSEPTEAEVFIDGKEIGMTPLETRVEPGEHEVKLVRERLGEATKVIKFKGYRKYQIIVTLGFYKYKFATKWGKKGQGQGEFYSPSSVVVKDGYVYVADVGNDRIQKFTTDGNFVSYFGKIGSEKGEFIRPVDLEICKKEIFVVDRGNNRIQKFDLNGKFLAAWGKYGDGPGEFKNPSRIASDNNNFIYVSDYPYSLQKFDTNGNFNAKLNIKAWDFDIDKEGNFYVLSDVMTDMILKYNSQGKLVKKIGPVRDLSAITVDNLGFIYVITYGGTIVKLTNKGSGTLSWETGSYFPFGIFVDTDGSIYIADTYNNRIQKFVLTQETTNDNWFINEVSAGAPYLVRRKYKSPIVQKPNIRLLRRKRLRK